MARAPLVDPAGRPITELSIAEIMWRGSWHRGRVLRAYRKWVAVELWTQRTKRLRESRRKPAQVYIVRGA